MPDYSPLTAAAFALCQQELGRLADDSFVAMYLNGAAAGMDDAAIRAIVRTTPEWHARHDPKPCPPRLTIRRDVFYTPAGDIWKWRGASAFQLLRDFLKGRDLTPVYDWARGHRVNVLRVFTRLAWAPLRESDYTDEQLVAFVRAVGAAGFYVELVGLADVGDSYAGWKMPLNEQKAHIERLARVVGDEPNVLLELCNEPEFNGVDPFAFSKPSKGVWSRGSASYMTLRDTLQPWDFVTFHEPRQDDWPMMAREAANVAWKYRVPVVSDEPVAMEYEGTDAAAWARNVADHEDFHALSHIFCAGSTIHTKALELDSVPPAGREEEGCRAIVAMWDKVPIDTQLGLYTAGHLTSGVPSCPVEFRQPDDPGCLRAFGMINGGAATVIRVRGTSAPVARDGWRITRQYHHLVFLER